MAKAHVVFVPGAWHGPVYMETVTSKLEALGYTVHGRQLPAIGNPNPPKDLSEDIAAVRSMVEEAIGDGNDVVVIPHSWGGVVAGSALVGLGKKEREAEGKKGGVTKAGYMAAFIVPEGVSLMDSLPGVLDWWDIDGPHVRATDPNIFYNDLSESEQKHWQSQLQTHALATFYAKSTGAGWRNIPTDYLVCEDDLAIPAAAQEGMVKAVKEAGADIEITRIKAGHSPFLSKPDETVAWIQKVAGD